MSSEVLIFKRGPVLNRAKIVLSFQGAGWRDGPITSADARRAFEAVLASPYMSHLVQYDIRRAKIVLALEDFRNLGVLGPDPRGFVAGNIWRVADEDIRNVARTALVAHPPDMFEDVFYFTVLSQDPIPIVLEHQDASGYHNQFQEGDRKVTYGVALHISSSAIDHSWHYLPGVFSHETVEACTNPDVTSGFSLEHIDGTEKAGELCDMDRVETVRLAGFEHDIDLSVYWSEIERRAVAPTYYSLRVALGTGPTGEVPSVADAMRVKSVRDFISAGFEA